MHSGGNYNAGPGAGWVAQLFDLPPGFALHERRMAMRAHDRWIETGRKRVTGFENNSLIIADPGGSAVVEGVGAGLVAAFGLVVGMTLDGQNGIAIELRAACDLIAIQRRPLPFEADVFMPGGATILVRGIVLPLAGPGQRSGEDRVQAIFNWRQLLTRGAAARLRREVGAALRMARPGGSARDPFAPDALA